MAVKVLELHHCGIRVGPSEADATNALIFYRDVLGLAPDPGRPPIPGQHGFWMDVGITAQIHLMGVKGVAKVSRAGEKDPSYPHFALAVPDIQEAKTELDRLGVDYWSVVGLAGPQAEQVFLYDPFGNLVELHQTGTCRCNKVARPSEVTVDS